MEPTDNSALVATLQLLLGDKTVIDKHRLLQAAFPEDLICVCSERAQLIVLSQAATECIRGLLNDQLMGDTALGKLAIEEVARKLHGVDNMHRRVRLLLGVQP